MTPYTSSYYPPGPLRPLQPPPRRSGRPTLHHDQALVADRILYCVSPHHFLRNHHHCTVHRLSICLRPIRLSFFCTHFGTLAISNAASRNWCKFISPQFDYYCTIHDQQLRLLFFGCEEGAQGGVGARGEDGNPRRH